MFSQDYSQQSSADAFPTTNKQLFCNGSSLEGGGEGAKFSKSHDEKAGDDKIETKTNKLVSRQSVSSEHSGDELFCLDDPNEGEGFGTFGGGARNARVVNGVIRLQSFTESDEEYRCEDDRRDALSEFQDEEEEEDGAKKYQQKYQQQWNNNNTFTAVRRGKTVRDLIERIIEFSTEPQISVWEDVLLDLRRKEDEDARFVLDVNEARHLQFRVPLVEWILDVCAGERYGPTTADVAIGYMVRGRCDATRSTVSPPGWLIPGEGARGDLIFAATDRDVRTNGEKNKTSETIRNARTRAMGTMAND